MTTATAGFRSDLEGLRGVAVLLVLLYHARAGVAPGGYVGVDVFFVLSGFLITRQIERELRATQTLSLASFYARRVRRLLPASLVVLGATLVASQLWLPPLDRADAARDVASAALYAANLRFALRDTDYLATDSAHSPLLHSWSLGVEEQFYLCWPLLLRLASAGSGTGARRRVWAVAAIAAASLALCVDWTGREPAWAFYSLPARAWELALGGLLALAGECGLRLAPVPATIAGLAGLSAIATSGLLFDSATAYPGHAALLPTLGAALVIAAGSGLEPRSRLLHRRLLDLGALRFLGRISYSLYLWHWPLLVIPAAARDATLSAVARLALVALAIALATATWRWIEEPIRRGKFAQRAPRRSLTPALVASAALAGTAIAVARASSVAPAAPLLTSSSPEVAANARTAIDWRGIAAAARRDSALVYMQHCVADFRVSEPTHCSYGSKSSETVVMLFGDSHAAQWFPALESIAKRRGWKLVTLLKGACPPIDATVARKKLHTPFAQCDRWRERALAEIERARPALVVVSFDRRYRLIDAGAAISLEESRSKLGPALSRSLRTISAHSDRVVVIGDTPHPQSDVPTCVSTSAGDLSACESPRSRAIDSEFLELQRSAAARAGAEFVDPSQWICSADPCPIRTSEGLVYRDDNHLTAGFAASLAPRLEAALELGSANSAR